MMEVRQIIDDTDEAGGSIYHEDYYLKLQTKTYLYKRQHCTI